MVIRQSDTRFIVREYAHRHKWGYHPGGRNAEVQPTMKHIIFVLVVVILLIGAGAVLAHPITPDGAAYPMPTTATIEPYPVVWPTATQTVVPTEPPMPTAKPKKTPATKTPPPLPDGLPYFPSE